jgi:FkbM family methyltransferase
MKLTHIIPTRGRPDRLLETVRHTALNMARADTRMLICVDDDDQPTLDIIPLLCKADDRIAISIKPREDSRGEKYDRALTEAPADLYLLGVDTVPILTPSYDQIFVDAADLFPDRIGCVYGPMANLSFPTLQAITARMADLIGYLYSHEYPFWFVDHELHDLCTMTGRYVFVDVAMPQNRTMQTIRLREVAWWANYFDAMAIERRATAHKIIDAMSMSEWEKAIRRTQYPVTELGSVKINNYVRGIADQIEKQRGEDLPPDAGYLRLKAAAEAKLRAMLPQLLQQAELSVVQPSDDPRIVIRAADVHGLKKDWAWPSQDFWGWQHPMMTWPGIRALLSNCGRRRVVVQAGGCCGMYPALLAREFKHVITAEIDPLNFECLTRNCPEPSITKIQAAFGDRDGSAFIDRPQVNNCGRHRIRDAGDPVPMITIDDLNLQVCDAILLDAEECETRIIVGAMETIRRCQPELIVAETISDEMVSLLAGEGYLLAEQAAHDRHFVKKNAKAELAPAA